jgi:hypothetical protein
MKNHRDMNRKMLEDAGGLWFLLIAVLLIGYLIVFCYNIPSCLYQLLAYVVTAAVIIFIPIKGLEIYTNRDLETYELDMMQETRQRQMAEDSAISKLRAIKNLQEDGLISEKEYTNWKKEILSDLVLDEEETQ